MFFVHGVLYHPIQLFDEGDNPLMIDEYSIIPASIFKIPVKEAKLYSRECEGFIYFWDPNDRHGSVIVDTTNGSYLSANKGVTYKALTEAFLKGYRS